MRLAVVGRVRGAEQATKCDHSFAAVHQQELRRVALRPFIHPSRDLCDSITRDPGLEQHEIVVKQFACAVSALRSCQLEIKERRRVVLGHAIPIAEQDTQHRVSFPESGL